MNDRVSLSRIWVSVGFLGLGQLLSAATTPTDGAKNNHDSHASAQPGKSADAGKPADATTADKDPNSYTNKETYPHSVGNASPTSLIAGGNTSGGSFAPSASVIAARIKEWKLSGSDIQAELDRGGKIERTKEAGANEPTGKTDDEALHTLINNRLLADTETVRVTTKDTQVMNGEVNVQLAAADPAMIGKAIAIVLDTPGVTKISAHAEIDPKLPGLPKDDAKRIPGAGTK